MPAGKWKSNPLQVLFLLNLKLTIIGNSRFIAADTPAWEPRAQPNRISAWKLYQGHPRVSIATACGVLPRVHLPKSAGKQTFCYRLQPLIPLLPANPTQRSFNRVSSPRRERQIQFIQPWKTSCRSLALGAKFPFPDACFPIRSPCRSRPGREMSPQPFHKIITDHAPPSPRPLAVRSTPRNGASEEEGRRPQFTCCAVIPTATYLFSRNNFGATRQHCKRSVAAQSKADTLS